MGAGLCPCQFALIAVSKNQGNCVSFLVWFACLRVCMCPYVQPFVRFTLVVWVGGAPNRAWFAGEIPRAPPPTCFCGRDHPKPSPACLPWLSGLPSLPPSAPLLSQQAAQMGRKLTYMALEMPMLAEKVKPLQSDCKVVHTSWKSPEVKLGELFHNP